MPTSSLDELDLRIIVELQDDGRRAFRDISRALGTPVRSLRRHLAAERTSFRQILQAHRRTAIEAILCSDGARLSDLASRLSYSDSAVLSRAFKSWTGMSPRAYATLRKR